MKSFWIKFTDGSEACCQGDSDYDAKIIAEKVSGKKVAQPLKPLPYPADPCIWKFEHPIHGRTPSFCYEPRKCAGRTSCPGRRSCTE